MGRFHWYTIFGWTLTAIITVMVVSVLTGTIFAVKQPAKPGYVVPGVEEAAAPAAAAAPAEQPIEFYLASANLNKGESQFKKCAVCHTIDKGAAHGLGPNLWGIVGNHHAHESDFDYSAAMKATNGETWNWDTLSQWIASPAKFIPNNKMAFAGISNPQDRADVIAFLNSKSDSPLPLPAAPAADAAPATDAAPAAPAAS